MNIRAVFSALYKLTKNGYNKKIALKQIVGGNIFYDNY